MTCDAVMHDADNKSCRAVGAQMALCKGISSRAMRMWGVPISEMGIDVLGPVARST